MIDRNYEYDLSEEIRTLKAENGLLKKQINEYVCLAEFVRQVKLTFAANRATAKNMAEKALRKTAESNIWSAVK